MSRLKTLSYSGVLEKFSFSLSNKYESCQLAKQVVMSFPTSNHLSSEIFDLVQSNIWGPTPVLSISG